MSYFTEEANDDIFKMGLSLNYFGFFIGERQDIDEKNQKRQNKEYDENTLKHFDIIKINRYLRLIVWMILASLIVLAQFYFIYDILRDNSNDINVETAPLNIYKMTVYSKQPEQFNEINYVYSKTTMNDFLFKYEDDSNQNSTQYDQSQNQVVGLRKIVNVQERYLSAKIASIVVIFIISSNMIEKSKILVKFQKEFKFFEQFICLLIYGQLYIEFYIIYTSDSHFQTLKGNSQQILTDLIAFMILNYIDVLLGAFFHKVIVEPLKLTAQYKDREMHYKFKFTNNELKASIVWVTIFIISYLFLILFESIESQIVPYYINHTPFSIYGEAILDVYINQHPTNLVWYFSNQNMNFLLFIEFWVILAPFTLLFLDSYFKQIESEKNIKSDSYANDEQIHESSLDNSPIDNTFAIKQKNVKSLINNSQQDDLIQQNNEIQKKNLSIQSESKLIIQESQNQQIQETFEVKSEKNKLQDHIQESIDNQKVESGAFFSVQNQQTNYTKKSKKINQYLKFKQNIQNDIENESNNKLNKYNISFESQIQKINEKNISQNQKQPPIKKKQQKKVVIVSNESEKTWSRIYKQNKNLNKMKVLYIAFLMFISCLFLSQAIIILIKLDEKLGIQNYCFQGVTYKDFGNQDQTKNILLTANQHTFQDSENYAIQQGGRLCRSDEIRKFLNSSKLKFSNTHSMVACYNGQGGKDWMSLQNLTLWSDIYLDALQDQQNLMYDESDFPITNKTRMIGNFTYQLPNWSNNTNYFDKDSGFFSYWVGVVVIWCDTSNPMQCDNKNNPYLNT